MKKFLIFLAAIVCCCTAALAENDVKDFTITYLTEDQYNSDQWTTDARYYASDDEWECYELYIGLNIPNVEVGKVYTEKDDAYAVYVMNPRGADRHDFVTFTLKFGPNHSFELTGVAVDKDENHDDAVKYRVKATYKGNK